MSSGLERIPCEGRRGTGWRNDGTARADSEPRMMRSGYIHTAAGVVLRCHVAAGFLDGWNSQCLAGGGELRDLVGRGSAIAGDGGTRGQGDSAILNPGQGTS